MDTITTLDMYLNGVTIFMFVVIFTLGALFWLRFKYASDCQSKVYAMFITKVGGSYMKLLPERHNIIELPADSKKGRGGKTFPISEVATVDTRYPLGMPRFLQANVKMAIFTTWNWEPISNRDEDPLMSPELLYNTINEKVTALSITYSEEIKELEERLAKALMRSINPTYVYILLIMAVAASGFAAYTIFEQAEIWDGIRNGVDAIKAGLGV